MTLQNTDGLQAIRRALISVSDKTGIVDFARELKRFDVEIISTGGTAKTLREAGIEVRDVSEITGFPEMMDGRIKTLHPRIHGALLALRDNPEHLAAMKENDIEPIDMVVVNLYPFEETIKRKGVTREEAIEQIDIGGPAMIRSAAKNAHNVAVVVLAKHYGTVSDELKRTAGSLSLETRNLLAQEAFGQTSRYDMIVTAYLSGAFARTLDERKTNQISVGGGGGNADFVKIWPDGIHVPTAPNSIEECKTLPERASWSIKKSSQLRYGENPHQSAALYSIGSTRGLASADLLAGKEMSFNNFVDADAARRQIAHRVGTLTLQIVGQRDRQRAGKGQLILAGDEGEDRGRAVGDDVELDAVEIGQALLPVVGVAHELDRLVALELDELERARADRLGAHVRRRHMAGIHRAVAVGEQCDE